MNKCMMDMEFPNNSIPPMASRSPPTPPVRQILLIKSETETNARDQCDRCKRFGDKQCASCHAASYCSRKCQTEAWRTHKAACKRIKAANAQLAQTVSVLGGASEEKFLLSPSVKEGTFGWFCTAQYREINVIDDGLPPPINPVLRYFTTRNDLIEYYVHVAYSSVQSNAFNGRTAFR